MNNKVIAYIDISTPEGRCILNDLKGKKEVTFEYPQEETDRLKEPSEEYRTESAQNRVSTSLSMSESIDDKTYSDDEVWEMVEERMSKHYGTKISIR
ncbi:MAG TPA: hypothetical protein DDZ96_03835 [Porphyromonadaceae bacterium]|jgi:hypothetical protein|uniref:hypothetical protein n=1 Tax=Limibacterium fermenti TaxID=3229863 RepID=UPI000E80BDAC|nr:hypothetical protein [Porphyromonadaceae bacterium]HBX21448.1 hypothetical protein [Porphyromonadaceae bacterium]HBX47213.1 hypothetical protein [Porphyromonadaceae bacterium]HCM19261.1 hypothetical protein [Porphyromonadaceae bacterium]